MGSLILVIESLLFCTGNRKTPTVICNQPRPIRRGLLIANLCLLLAILAGCRQTTHIETPVSYEDLCGLTSEQMGTMDEANVQQWIKEKYNATPTQSQQIMGGEAVTVYIWEHDGITGNAYVRDDRLFRISLYDLDNNVESKPTFGQVVAGLGPPEMLDRTVGMYDPLQYTIILDYPALGVSMSGTEAEARNKLVHEGVLAAVLTERMQADNVHCYIPGSMEAVLQKIFFVSPENVPRQMQTQIPWPGFGALVPLEYH